MSTVFDTGVPGVETHIEAQITAVYEDIVSRLDDSYTLVYVHYDESLSDAQVQQILDGNALDVEDELHEVCMEQRAMSAIEIANDEVESFRGVYDDEVLDEFHDGELFDELRFQIEDRDDSDVLGELIRNTS